MNPVVTTEADKPGIGSLRPSIPALLILAACTAGIALSDTICWPAARFAETHAPAC